MSWGAVHAGENKPHGMHALSRTPLATCCRRREEGKKQGKTPAKGRTGPEHAGGFRKNEVLQGRKHSGS